MIFLNAIFGKMSGVFSGRGRYLPIQVAIAASFLKIWPASPQPSAVGLLPEELELELIQSHMAQKPVLRGEVGCACVAREVSVERGGLGERGCARRLGGWVWV